MIIISYPQICRECLNRMSALSRLLLLMFTNLILLLETFFFPPSHECVNLHVFYFTPLTTANRYEGGQLSKNKTAIIKKKSLYGNPLAYYLAPVC